MKVIRQGVPALLLSLAILSGSVCLASGAEVQTVRATLWDAWPITVDETPICTVNEYDRFQYPLAYNGSVYIPLQTVSDWLGARFDWDETANTVTLTKTGDPYYRHYTLDQPAPWTEEELAQCDADKAEGVEMELRPDIQIYLDGEKQTFTDAAGNRIPPGSVPRRTPSSGARRGPDVREGDHLSPQQARLAGRRGRLRDRFPPAL